MKKRTPLPPPNLDLDLVLNSFPVRVFIKDRESNFIRVNSDFAADFGFSSPELMLGKNDFDIIDNPDQAKNCRSDDAQVMDSKRPKLGIIEEINTQGNPPKWLKTDKVPILDTDNHVIGLLGTYIDITEDVLLRNKFKQEAEIDVLTNLANRRRMQNMLTSYEGTGYGLMFIDLDGFKLVNDTLGHLVGDDVLRQFAKRLRNMPLPEGGLLARLGGDEFSIFLPLDNIPESKKLLKSVASAVIKNCDIPFKVDVHTVNVSASIGITTSHQKNRDYSLAFKQADLAMYKAKEKNVGSYEFFSQSMMDNANRKLEIKTALYTAIKKQAFKIAYQPQLNCHGTLIGAEALLRCESSNPIKGTIQELIHLAEEIGAINSLGRWIACAALDDLKLFKQTLKSNDSFKLSLNISERQLQEKGFSGWLLQETKTRGIHPKEIELEITESLLLETDGAAVNQLLQLSHHGFSIAIDDFGTGFSSLSYLAKLPINTIKIDKSFTKEIDKNKTNNRIIEAIISLAETLTVELIAEGVEREEEFSSLCKLGCTKFQGYYFGEPVMRDDFLSKHIKN